jgi:hypothetical protein
MLNLAPRAGLPHPKQNNGLEWLTGLGGHVEPQSYSARWLTGYRKGGPEICAYLRASLTVAPLISGL